MKQILTILITLITFNCLGQNVPFGASRAVDTSKTVGSLYVGGQAIIKSLATTDTTNKVVKINSYGNLFLGTISTSGSTDSFVYSTKAYRQKGIDSVNGTVAARVKYTDTAAMLTPYLRFVDSSIYSTKSYRQKGIDSVNINVALRELLSNKVTSFSSPDNTTYPTTAAVNTLVSAYKLKSDSVANDGYTRRDRAQHIADSVAALIPSVTGYVPYTGATTNVNLGAHNLTATRGNFDTLEPNTSAGLHIHNTSHQDIMIAGAGGGQTLTIYAATNLDANKIQNSVDTVLTTNSSGTIGKTAIATYYVKKADSFDYSTRAWRQKAVDSLNTVIATKGSGTVTNVIGGTNISITGTSTIQPTVNITGTIAVANGGTGTTATTSVNTTPITYGANNTVTASANTLTTTTLNPTVVTSSLTSVGTVTGGTWSSSISGTATGSTQAINTNNTTIATTAYADRYHPTDTTISAAYTLTSRDFYRTIHCTNGSNIALTIPTGLGTTFTCVVLAEGAGTVTPTTSSTTFNFQPTSTTKIKSNGGATIRSYATANTYLIIGSLE